MSANKKSDKPTAFAMSVSMWVSQQLTERGTRSAWQEFKTDHGSMVNNLHFREIKGVIKVMAALNQPLLSLKKLAKMDAWLKDGEFGYMTTTNNSSCILDLPYAYDDSFSITIVWKFSERGFHALRYLFTDFDMSDSSKLLLPSFVVSMTPSDDTRFVYRYED